MILLPPLPPSLSSLSTQLVMADFRPLRATKWPLRGFYLLKEVFSCHSHVGFKILCKSNWGSGSCFTKLVLNVNFHWYYLTVTVNAKMRKVCRAESCELSVSGCHLTFKETIGLSEMSQAWEDLINWQMLSGTAVVHWLQDPGHDGKHLSLDQILKAFQYICSSL